LVAKVVKSLLQSASPLSEVSGALLFMKALSSANEAYLVGGGVRDLILNRRAYDLDIIVPGAREIAQNLSEQLEDMKGGVRKAIQIEFELEHYQEAFDLVKFWRDRGAYVGSMIIEYLKAEKSKL